MSHNMKNGGKFYFADCDLSAIIYVAIGQRLGLPIAFIEVPEHNFVRWSSSTLKMNWDTNDGRSYSDAEYAARWGVTQIGRKRLGWLVDMPRARIMSYWWEMIGNWHMRHGRSAEALSAFRSAVNTNPGDLDAENSLAWFLATCADPKLRNGATAESIAKRVVKAAPRANWIDTLAAAQAETGDFSTAVETELKAKKAAKTREWGIGKNENIAGFDKCIAVYRLNTSYRKAVEMGLIKDPMPNRPYD
jgi:tetratricopeptide (TPR) repeat protein